MSWWGGDALDIMVFYAIDFSLLIDRKPHLARAAPGDNITDFHDLVADDYGSYL